MKDRKIILNQIRTPDGTVLKSMHVHDYVEYTDKNGFTYMVDGGTCYLRRNIVEEAPYEELSIYSNAPYEVIRENFHRGGRGKNGDEPLTWTPLSKMSDSWVLACISYNEEKNLGDSYANDLYKKELIYRQEKNIQIND